ncbi:immunity protein Imm33 domain-containing protein, partial [Acinetobacter baumannii]
MHISHLENYLPEVIPYLALEERFRFVIDKQGYEDVWKEE